MSQSTLGDDDLFGEAAAEMRADVEEHLGEARSELPDPDDVWEAEADNVLGVLNGLRSSLNVEGAAEHVRQAKKWYVIGQRAEAFDDPEDLEEAIEELEELIEMVDEAHELVGELTNTMPQLRGALTDAAEAAEAAADDAEEDEEDEE
ncbi:MULTISPECIES: DUF5790 family protein [Haloferax]|uniref:Uncharacterized protein n=1 Tax=Haloferax massiliensis TaxID=1476858 RepID=A0A0D6JT49_9EURY|nr:MULTISPECIES: DUF5790 family protein [Haloferax]MDS0242011.1 DUF5790 family protein [Haloferax sp. S2CR25]MDS0445132.1 DUF5790 family protein [Haloferax sp. S2CR25-2]CQR51019.1 hypothetical protein BN996_02508 [Haloferax massiliensis]